MIFVYVHVDLHNICIYIDMYMYIQMYRHMRFGTVTSTSWDLGGSKQIAKSA